jgi:hypothetical protein
MRLFIRLIFLGQARCIEAARKTHKTPTALLCLSVKRLVGDMGHMLLLTKKVVPLSVFVHFHTPLEYFICTEASETVFDCINGYGENNGLVGYRIEYLTANTAS